MLDAAGADDRRVEIGVREGEAQQERGAGRAVEQLVELPAVPACAHRVVVDHVVAAVLPVIGRAARDAAADDDPRAGRRGARDRVLVLALERRVGNLEGVEDAHLDLLVERRQDARDADVADLALVAHRERLAQRPVRVELLAGEAAVELDEVEMVGRQQPQALLDARADVLRGVHVLTAQRRARNAAALRGEHVLRAAVRDEPADQLLAAPVVDRGVDEVDALVEDGAQQRSRLRVAQDRAASAARAAPSPRSRAS